MSAPKIISSSNPRWFCRNEMIWDSDFSFEDVGLEGEGIVAYLHCSNDKCGATAEYKTKEEE